MRYTEDERVRQSENACDIRRVRGKTKSGVKNACDMMYAIVVTLIFTNEFYLGRLWYL